MSAQDAPAVRPSVTQLVEQLGRLVLQNQESQQQAVSEIRRLADVIAQQSVAGQHVRMPTTNVFQTQQVKLELPPVFNGNPSKLNGWIFQVEQYCQLVNIQHEVDYVKLGVSRLVDDALTWWRGYAAQHNDALSNLSWQDFRIELEHAFEDVDKELKLRRQLANLKQQGSVQNYTRSFRNIVLELGSRAPDDGNLVFQFIEGLKDAVKTQVLLQRPQLLAEAEQLAERADMTLFQSSRRSYQENSQRRWPRRDYEDRRNATYNQRPYDRRQHPEPMQLGEASTPPRYNAPSQQRRWQNNPKQYITCFKCGRRGHYAKDCRVRPPDPPPFPTLNNAEVPDDSSPTSQCQSSGNTPLN